MAKDPQPQKDDFLYKYKTIDAQDTLMHPSIYKTSLKQKEMNFSKYFSGQEDRTRAQISQNSIYETCPKLEEKDVFYKKLRQRKQNEEIQGPIKLRMHSSLERVYENMQTTGSVENQLFNQVYFNSHDIKPVQTNVYGQSFMHKRRSITTADLNTSKIARNIRNKLALSVVNPGKRLDQSILLKNVTNPIDNYRKSHYRGAQSLLMRNSGSLKYNEDEFDRRFNNLDNSVIFQGLKLKNIDNKDINKQRVQTITTEVLKVCNIMRTKKVELENVLQVAEIEAFSKLKKRGRNLAYNNNNDAAFKQMISLPAK